MYYLDVLSILRHTSCFTSIFSVVWCHVYCGLDLVLYLVSFSCKGYKKVLSQDPLRDEIQVNVCEKLLYILFLFSISKFVSRWVVMGGISFIITRAITIIFLVHFVNWKHFTNSLYTLMVKVSLKCIFDLE